MVKYIILFISSILLFQNAISQNEIKPDGFNVFYYSNGQKSAEGNFVNGKPEGFWKNYFETGVLKSEGNRKDHLLDSTWLFYFENGLLKQRVNYEKSLKEGYSHYYSEEGFLLEKVPYQADTIQGIGYAYFTDIIRIQYQKPYERGMLSGTGYQFGRDGRIIGIITYENDILKSIQNINRLNAKNEKIGLWITYYENVLNRKAKLLEGRYKHGLKNGYFREYDKKGRQLSTTKYVNGEVVVNAEELMSVDLVREFYPNAAVKWEKTYLGVKPHGVWKQFDTSGIVIRTIIYRQGIVLGEGIIDSKGIKQGKWKEYYNEGSLRGEGAYFDGARMGDWKYFHPNGKLEQKGTYRKGGRPHGEWLWFYDNGALKREEIYFNGKEDGLMTEYDLEGNILEEGNYVEGLMEGDWMINSGDYIESGQYIEGMMNGDWKGVYKSTGKTAFLGKYIEDQPHNKHTHYYPSGRKMLEGKYELGVKVGDWKRFDESGLLMLTIRYKYGVAQKIGGKKVLGNDTN